MISIWIPSSRLLLLLLLFFEKGASLDIQLRGPRFTIEPNSRVDFSNSSGTAVPCTAEGRPMPSIAWTRHEGQPLQDIPGLRHVRHDGSLVFSPFSPDEYRADVHATTYRCVATNSVGAIASRDVNVRAVVNQKYEIHLFDEFVLKGNMAVLRCPVPSFVSDYVRVTSWERVDGFLITPGIISGKYGMLENGDLYFRDITERDAGFSYRCHTENLITREKKVSANYSKVIVTEPHHSQSPRIVRRSSRVRASTGRRATLWCVSQGHPAPTYRWQRLGAEPDPSSARHEGGVLVFSKVRASDAGGYSCIVSNAVGEDRADMELVVEESLRVSITPPELHLDVGKSATLNCSVPGRISGAGGVQWAKDGRPLPGGSRLQFPAPTTLQLRQLRRHDAGMYQCFVRREDDSAQASARLVIGDLAAQFKLAFPEKTVRPGSFVSLVCIATGNPSPQIKWTLDDIWTLSTRPGVMVSTYISGGGDVVSYVNITSADVTDGGVYTCTAFNEAGLASHSRRLNVFGSLFIRPLNNLTALAGGVFRVLCPFGGYPFESVMWKREGRVLPANQRQHVFQNGTLLITEVQPGIDDGRYSCEVRSQQGTPVSRTFRISIRTGPKIATFNFRDNLHEGMRTAVTCIVTAGDGPLTTSWMKDGLPLEEEQDTMIVYADEGFVSTLTLKNLAHRHNGNYTCVARNDVAAGSHSSTLTVKVPPRWIIEPSDITAVAGRPAKIDCQADGVPLPHVRWKVSSGEPPEKFKTIVSSSHVHILVNGSLNFQSIETSDEGFYLCEANNGVGAGLSTVVRLSVHSAPQFHSKYAMMTARRGERTNMECHALGDKPMSFSWKKNGITLDPVAEMRYSQISEESPLGGQSKLIIEKVEKRDSALFTCTAVNDYGDDAKNIQLTIQDIPDAPQSTEVHDVSSRSVRLSWSKPFDGNSPITQYTVMWRQLGEQSGTGGPVTVPGVETSLVIRGLRPKNRYFFRVKCENALGESQFGAEVAITTMEEPPRRAPHGIRAVPLSSRSINVTWQVFKDDESDSVDGYYVGYKMHSKSEAYTFKALNASSLTGSPHFLLENLTPLTDYSILVQGYNGRGAGPPSEPVISRTLEFDKPAPPMVKTYYATAKTIKLSWDPPSSPNSPVSGYILHHRMEERDWREVHLTGDRSSYTLHDLQCGTSYSFFLVAFNSAGHGNSSEIISAKTDGTAPITPDKARLLTVNSTSACINLNSWHNGGCPITFFVIQYRASGSQEWTLVSNNIIPDQQNITITDLSPGSWYNLLMTAKNEAGTTDSEYVFATLTTTGEHPPRPSEMSEMNSAFYRHLTITVPVVSSAIVLVVVLCAVCFITRRRTTDRTQRTPDGGDGGEPMKPESVPLSVTYDGTQEPAYYPTPYVTSRVPGYGEHCVQPAPQKNMGTFGSSRGGYTYDIPYPSRRSEKVEGKYESPAIYFPAYHHTGVEIRSHRDRVIYTVSERSRRKLDKKGSWRSSGDGNSSTESDNEEIVYAVHASEDRIFRDEARESETECDRLWKTYESCQYEDTKRWKAEHAVMS